MFVNKLLNTVSTYRPNRRVKTWYGAVLKHAIARPARPGMVMGLATVNVDGFFQNLSVSYQKQSCFQVS